MSTNSNSDFDAKLRTIRAAADLFHKQGIISTSTDEIMEASRTGKGQFYHYFKNKYGLVHQVLLYYLDLVRTGGSPINYEIHTWTELENFFRVHLELQKNVRMTRGCPLGTIGNELTENDELVRQDLNLIFEVICSKLVAFFTAEKARGRLIDAANPKQMAEFCVAALQGAMLIGKIKRDSAFAESVIQSTMESLRLKRLPG